VSIRARPTWDYSSFSAAILSKGFVAQGRIGAAAHRGQKSNKEHQQRLKSGKVVVGKIRF
jgi:hypothetical protein